MVANKNLHPRRSAPLWTHDEIPADIEAEMVALGSLILADVSTYARVRACIPTSGVFMSPDHQEIFGIVAEIRDGGGGMDGMILRKALEDRGVLESVGGIEYLADLMSNIPNVANVDSYVARLNEVHRLRTLDQLASRLATAIRRPSYSRDKADALIERMQAELANMIEVGATTEIKPLSDVVQEAVASMKSGGAPRIKSGILSIDESIGGFGQGEMALIAARPSMGKSLLGKQMADLMAQSNVPVGYVNLEESNQKLARNWLSRNAKIENQRVRRGQLSNAEWATVDQWAAFSQHVPLFCCERAMTLGGVCNVVALMKARFKIQAVFIDYLQLIETRGGKGINREQEVATISRRLKNLFKKLGIAGVVMAQVNRSNEKGGPVRAPRMGDLRESGQIEQDADVILMIHRPDYYERGSGGEATNEVQVVVAKYRDGGRGNDVKLTADLEHQEFVDDRQMTDPYA